MPQIAQMMQELPVEYQHNISHLNWPKEWPAAPQTRFCAAHNGHEMIFRFDVTEDCTMALVDKDNGQVWTDSAVEIFMSFDDSGYYNFEFTCIGRALAGFRKSKPDVTHADAHIMVLIKRYSSLGDECFAEKHIPQGWNLTIVIPVEALFAHKIETLDGMQAAANVYKCGDNLSRPHFVSWSPIDSPSPNFHLPQFFKPVNFE